MGKIKFDDNKPLIKNKAFYIAFMVCLAAFGLISYATVARMNQQETTPSIPESSAITSSFSAVDQNMSNVSYPEEKTTVTATDSPVEDDSVLTGAAPFFTLPVAGELLKDYDPKALQYSETYKDWRLHLGIDLAGDKGTPVYSCAQGVVEEIYTDSDWGTVVVLDHGEGILAYYCGLNAKPVVKTGEEVESGKQIGVIDTIPCECVEQAHLHLFMEKDGQTISPFDLIKR